MENNYKQTKKDFEGEVIGYKILLRRTNPDKETARDLYIRIRDLTELAA